MRVTLAVTALMIVCGSQTSAASQIFTPTVRYDTVTVVGGAGERNPLFVYDSPFPVYLLDSTTVAYADGARRGSSSRTC